MAIKQASPFNWRLPSWLTQCDYCGTQSKKFGTEPGEAAEFARKEGFSTIIIRSELPMKWKCYGCTKDTKPQGKVNHNA